MVSKRRHRPIMALLVLALCLMGCHRNHRIDPSELLKLDGFYAGDEIPLTDLASREIRLTSSTPITFVLQTRMRIHDRYVSISITDGVFKGTTVDGRESAVRLSDVEAAAVSILSTGKVIGFAIAGVAVVSFIVGFIWFLIENSVQGM